MNLRITDSNEDYGIDTYKLSIEDFSCKEFHPMIATTKWQHIYIDLTDKTLRGIIRQLLPICKVTPVFDRSSVTVRTVQLLCEIYQDEASKLRSLFMEDQSKFFELVDELMLA